VYLGLESIEQVLVWVNALEFESRLRFYVILISVLVLLVNHPVIVDDQQLLREPVIDFFFAFTLWVVQARIESDVKTLACMVLDVPVKRQLSRVFKAIQSITDVIQSQTLTQLRLIKVLKVVLGAAAIIHLVDLDSKWLGRAVPFSIQNGP
jgi:hypothetical protein